MAWEVLISTAGGAAATCLGVFAGGMIGRRSQDRQWLRDARTDAYRTVLHNYAKIDMELRAAHFDKRNPVVDWSAWSAAIMSVSLVADRRVEAALMNFGLQVGRFADLVIQHRLTTKDALTTAGYEVGRAQLEFVNAARTSLSSDQQPLATWLGGPSQPSPDDGPAVSTQP